MQHPSVQDDITIPVLTTLYIIISLHMHQIALNLYHILTMQFLILV